MRETTRPETAVWMKAIAKYRKPVLRSSLWQIANSLIPYLALWGLMIWSLNHSYWFTVGLAFVASGFLIRIFIIFHDCGHGSFFVSQRANRFVEFVTGVLAFAPYRQWRHKHAKHHATSGDLDRRTTGEVKTMTVDEYLAASRGKRFAYRLARNPFILFGLGPLYVFLIQERFPSRVVGKREHQGVFWTNVALLTLVIVMSWAIGFKAYVMIQLPVILFSGLAGIWLFYVQHQYEDVQWERSAEWNYLESALQGSSYYKLPKVLQWFSGNIGFHHVHHLNPTIPNYNLEKCHNEIPMFQEVKPLTMWASLSSISLRLWDEKEKKLVSFRQARALRS